MHEVTQAQFDTLVEHAKRWGLPDLTKPLNVVEESELQPRSYYGFWTGGVDEDNRGQGMFIGVELDGYAHS